MLFCFDNKVYVDEEGAISLPTEVVDPPPLPWVWFLFLEGLRLVERQVESTGLLVIEPLPLT